MRFVGLGDQVVDKYTHVKIMYPGGNALNFAVFAGQHGIFSAFLGVFGSDKEGDYVRRCAQKIGIDISRCRCCEGKNGYTETALNCHGDRIFIGGNHGGVLREKGLRLVKEDYDYLLKFDLIHSSIYSYAENEIKKLKEEGGKISFDFSEDFTEEYLKEMLPYVDYAFFSGSRLTESQRRKIHELAVLSGCRLSVCTCGIRGAYAFDGENEFYQRAETVKAHDTMAAGDAFITGFIVSYLNKEKSIQESMADAALFAAKQCMRDGSFGFGKEYEE